MGVAESLETGASAYYTNPTVELSTDDRRLPEVERKVPKGFRVAGLRPERPLEDRTDYVRYGLLTSHLLVPYSSFLWVADLVNRAGSSTKTAPLFGFFALFNLLVDCINGVMPVLAKVVRRWRHA